MSLSDKKASDGQEMMRITRKENRRTSGEGGKKGVREERNEPRREGGVVAMPANRWRGGAKTRDHS